MLNIISSNIVLIIIIIIITPQQAQGGERVGCLIVESRTVIQRLVHAWLTTQKITHIQALDGQV